MHDKTKLPRRYIIKTPFLKKNMTPLTPICVLYVEGVIPYHVFMIILWYNFCFHVFTHKARDWSRVSLLQNFLKLQMFRLEDCVNNEIILF